VIGARFDARMNRLLTEANIRRLLNEEPGRRRRLFEAVHVAALDPGTLRIKGIGFNEPFDLMLNNFGLWFAMLVSTPGATPTCTVTDTGNNARTLQAYGGNVFDNVNSMGTRLQLGSSSTTPARTDIAIGTALPTAPESGVFGSGAGSYASGVVSWSASVTAGGAGTVRESGFFGYFGDNVGTLRTIMLFHDLISPVVPYVAGNVLTCSYSMNV